MGFSKDTVGFYLALEDTLTPTLGLASKGYDKFVKALDKANSLAFRSAKKGFAALAGIVEAFDAMPKKAMKSYASAMSAIEKKSKPLKVALAFTVSKAAEKKLDSIMLKAVSNAFGKATFRFSSAMPTKRSNLFNSKHGLRTQYKGAIQPPDFLGKVKIPKFSKGGQVKPAAPGMPHGGGTDSVLSFLTPGESVNTVDETKALKDLGGQAHDTAGKFTAFPKELIEALTDSKNLIAAMPKLKAAMELGLDPKAGHIYEANLKKIDGYQEKLSSSMGNLSTASRVKLAPAIQAVNAQLAAMKPAEEEAHGAIEGFLKSILGDTRFLAISKAVETLQENFMEIHHAAGELSEFAELHKTGEGLVENFLDMNKTLHMTGEELNDFRTEALDAWKELPLGTRSVSELSDSLRELIESGMDKKLAVEYSKAVYIFAKATGVARDEAVDLANVMAKQLNMGADDAADTFADLAKIAGQAGVSMDMLAPILKEVAHDGQQFFAELNPEDARNALESIARISAAVAKATDADTAKEFAAVISGALSDADKMGTLAGVLGTSTTDLKKQLLSGDLTGFFKEIDSAGPQAATEIAKAFGASGKAIFAMTNRTEQMNAALNLTTARSTTAGKGLDVMSESAMENMTTFEKLKAKVHDWASQFTFVQNMLQFFEDLNPMVLLSSAYLVTKLVPAFNLFGGAAKEAGEGAKATEAASTLLSKSFGLLWKGATALWGMLPFVSGGMTATAAATAATGTAAVAAEVALAPLIATFGLVAIGIAAVVGLLYYFRKELIEVGAAFIDGFVAGFGSLEDLVKPLKDSFVELWGSIKQAFSPLVDIFASSGDGTRNIQWLTDAASNLGWLFGTVIGGALGQVVNIISTAVKLFGDVFSLVTAVGQAIGSWSFAPIIEWVRKLGQHLLDFVLSPINKILTTFGMDPIKVDLIGTGTPAAGGDAGNLGTNIGLSNHRATATPQGVTPGHVGHA